MFSYISNAEVSSLHMYNTLPVARECECFYLNRLIWSRMTLWYSRIIAVRTIQEVQYWVKYLQVYVNLIDTYRVQKMSDYQVMFDAWTRSMQLCGSSTQRRAESTRLLLSSPSFPLIPPIQCHIPTHWASSLAYEKPSKYPPLGARRRYGLNSKEDKSKSKVLPFISDQQKLITADNSDH